MRQFLQIVATLALLGSATAANAVTIGNDDPKTVHIYVCDKNCGPDHGDDWGMKEFTLSPGETRTFTCSGECYVGTYAPDLGDLATAGEDEFFTGDQSGHIRKGLATHN